VKKATWRKFMRGNSVQRDLDEIKSLALRYIKEETIQPIKDMGRFVAWGALGSLLVGFGYFFCSSAHCDSCKTSSRSWTARCPGFRT